MHDQPVRFIRCRHYQTVTTNQTRDPRHQLRQKREKKTCQAWFEVSAFYMHDFKLNSPESILSSTRSENFGPCLRC